jgi:hypothetical protein
LSHPQRNAYVKELVCGGFRAPTRFGERCQQCTRDLHGEGLTRETRRGWQSVRAAAPCIEITWTSKYVHLSFTIRTGLVRKMRRAFHDKQAPRATRLTPHPFAERPASAALERSIAAEAGLSAPGAVRCG